MSGTVYTWGVEVNGPVLMEPKIHKLDSYVSGTLDFE